MTPFRWGILGAARIARALIPAIREAGGEVTALGVRDPSSQRAQDFAREWNVPLVGGYEQVIQSDVDAVYNPLPNDLHHPWTLAALRAGKHALTEKPFTLNAAEAQELADTAQERGLTLLEAFAPRFHPYMHRVREIVQGGELGEVRSLHASFGFHLNNPEDFRWNADQGGGALFDVGTYCVNVSRLLLGEPLCVLGRARWTPGGVDAGFSGVLEYPQSLVTLEAGFDWTEPSAQRLTVIGTHGTLDTPHVSSGGTAPIPLHITTQAGPRTEDIPPANAYALMVTHFQRSAQGQVNLQFGPSDAVQQSRVLDALFQSARSGNRVTL